MIDRAAWTLIAAEARKNYDSAGEFIVAMALANAAVPPEAVPILMHAWPRKRGRKPAVFRPETYGETKHDR